MARPGQAAWRWLRRSPARPTSATTRRWCSTTRWRSTCCSVIGAGSWPTGFSTGWSCASCSVSCGRSTARWSRARFSEDALHAAIARGVRQYVIVGAGLDTFALRQPGLADRLTVFELDHPASQNLKRKLIERIGPVPRNLEFVEADFERESVGEALQKSCFDPAEPCFLSWLGTTFYLTEAATLATLCSITDCAAPGSELVFDFCVPEESLGPHDRAELAALKRLAARRGEPFVSSFLPAQLAERISGLGLELIEHASPDALERRYFANRGDGFRPSHFAWLAHVKVPLRHPDQSQPRRRFDAPQ
ncbi:MAG: class I SAM-dependent methyltransferase [Sterolibacteriaceae bacterium]|nr:class I SAM-dependent methyltransferase [Sterolibacteriaceae bacterium]